ncbi:MAG: hypothetical protein AAGA76_00285 [Pseudomonadota bacterium]
MAEKDLEAVDIERKIHDLADAMMRVRSAQADRDDVIVEMKDAKFNRLKILLEEIEPFFDQIPDDNEQFEFAVTNGETPRLWVDMTSFVRMAADGREYEFVKDTRLGRLILGRSSNREMIGERITEYVAERLLERERMIEGDWISAKALLADTEQVSGRTDSTSETDQVEEAVETENKSGSSTVTRVLMVLALALLFVLVAMATDQLEPLLTWFRTLNA